MAEPTLSRTDEALQIDHSVFDTRALVPGEQASAWTETISSIFDVTLGAEDVSRGYAARVEGALIGPHVIGRVQAGPQLFIRSGFRSYTDGLEGYVVQSFGRGAVRAANETTPLAGQGQLFAIDLRRPLETVNTDFDLVSFFLPRDVLERGHASGPHLMATSQDSVLGRMTAQFLLSFQGGVRQMDAEEAQTAANAALELVAECFRGETRRSLTETSHRLALLDTVRARISALLDLGDAVDIDALSRWAGCSRATLYRVFEPIGGVAEYIRHQRLGRVLKDFASHDPVIQAQSIGEIANRHGFGSDAHFSRAFKAVFGLSPSDARRQLSPQPASENGASGTDRRYELWMKLVS